MEPYIFNLTAVALIGFIIWWFWLSKPTAVKSQSNRIKINIKDGVYQPSNIELQANMPITLEFIREDGAPCSEYVLFDELDIKEKIALHKPHAIYLGKLKPGEYQFGCQMKMYVGMLIVK